MKQFNTILKKLGILACLLAGLNSYSQAWQVYTCNTQPQDPAIGFVVKDDYPGATFIEEIIDDPDIAGNKLFKYVQNDDTASRRTYRMSTDMTGVTSFTMVTRVRGTTDIADTASRIMELDVRSATNNSRSKLTIRYDDTLSLYNPSTEKAHIDSLSKWHLYRFTMDGTTFTAYIDEDPSPILSGTSTATTSDDYFKWADGSQGSTFSFLMDWLIWDVSGAYAPGTGAAIPDSLSTDHHTASGNEIKESFVENKLSIYPIPAYEFVYVKAPIVISDGNLAVYNILGKCIYKKNITRQLTQVDISSFTQGVNVVRLRANGRIYINQMVVK